MIDLSFLTEAEQEAILKVLNRDAELKKTEDQRVRELQDKVNDENELKYKSGQWFYEAKSRRHRDKIHGADLVRASIRKRKKPATIAELSQSSRNQSQRSWVNSINQDIFIPPELYGVMEPPDEKEEDLMPSKADTNQSAKRVSFKSPGTDKDVMKNGTASPSRQRKNPFNSEGALEERDLNIESPEPMLVNGQEGKKRDPMSSVYKLGVKLPYPSPIGSRRSSQEAEENPPMKQPPVPKPRKLVINGQPPEHSNSSLQREDSLNSKNKRKGILKRRSSSSSTDSESLRISQNIEPTKLVLPSSPILEAEQSPSFDDQILSDNSPDRQKQVRFSERVLQKPPTPNPESYSVRETDEFGILEPGSHYYDFDFVDHPHYEESKPTQHSQNITEVLSQRSLEEDPISLTLQTNPSEWKLEDPSQGIKINGVNGTLDESSPEISIDSAGTEPLYAEVKKSPKSTSSDQAKDIETDALMEPRFHSQGWKTENTEKPLEFGKSYGGGGKINYGLRSSTDQPGKGYASTNEDILAPEKATNVQSSSQNFVDEPKPGTNGDYFPKWRRPRSMEIDDVVAQPMAEQEFPNVNVRDYTDTFVKAYPENSSNNSLGEFKTETKRQTISLRNAPNVDGRQEGPSSNFPIAQNMSISSRPASGDFKTHDTFLRDGRDRRISPTSANFKVMSMKDRIHDTSREQMSNPSQFQSLRHFWNAEDKNWSKGDLDPSPEKILTNVSKRNKPTRADLKQRHSRDVPTDDQSLPSSFDSLSEEEQTSQKVTSWLAQTPTVYGVEEVDANEDQDHSGEEVMENIEKTLVYRKRQDEEFSNALQKLKHEALEAPVMPKTEHLRSEDFQVSPVKESGLFDRKENKTSILVKSAESRPATGFYERVVQISNKQSPAKEEEKFVEPPSQRYSTEVDEHVNRTVAPAKMANEFKIGFQKLQEEYESASSQCDDERQVEKSNLPSEEQQLIETNETVDITSVPKGNDHQEFISALKRLEMEASTPSIVEDEDEQPEEVATVNTVTPVKSSFQIGFDHHTPIENEGTFETPQKLNVTYAIQSSPPYNEDTNGIEEVVLKTTAPSKKDDNDLVDALNKLELEAAAEDSSVELEEVYEKPKITPTIQSARSNSGEQSFVTPSVDVQNLSSPTHSVESTPENEDAYLYRTRRSTQEADDTFDGQGKLPVEEPPIEKTISDTEESNSDYKNRLLRLEEEAAASITEEPEDESVRETFSVSPAPTKEVTISKKVFSSVETTPTELPSSQPKPDTYKELANVPQSPSDQSGSFPGSARNVLYTKPDSSEVLKSKQENKYPTEKVEASDSNEEVNETIEKTVIPPKTDLDDFDRKLQNLYNESLNTIDLPNGHMIKPENVDINEPTLNIGKVLQVSPINQDKNVQSPVVATGLQPVAINFSSKKTEMVNEDLDKPQQNIPTETTSADVSTEPLVDVNFYEVPKISSEKPTYELNGSSPRKLDINELSSEPNDYKVPLPEPEKQTKKEIMERIEEPVVLPRPRFDDFHEKLNQLYEESQKSQPNIGDSNNIAENETVGAENKANVYLYPVEPKKTFLESSPVNLDSSQIVSADPETLTDESAPPHSQAPDILGQEVNETMAKTIAPKRISTAKSLEELQKEALNEQEGGFVGNVPSGHMILNESHSNDQELKENSILETFPRNKDDAVQWRTEPTGYEELQEGTAESSAPFMAVRQSTPVKDKNSSLRKSTLELYLEAPYRRELSKSIDFDLSAYVTSDVNQCMDESNPILKALQRSTAKTLNSTAVQETSPTSTNQSKLNSQKADTLGPVENTFPENAEKFKRMSQSVPTFLQDETDGRETDSASESSFQIGRHKKSPSSLTNLSGSSGMASMSSVSGSVMSVYSGDFGNVDVKGAIEFAIDYVEQLKEFHIFIYQCKDLAAADVKKQRSDPYVKSYLLPEKAKMGKRKTAVKKKTLNPIYNEILRYKIPQESLKSQTLNVSVWHHDALGRNSFLGEVNLNLAMWDFKVSQRHWFPLEPRTPVHGVGLENRGEMKLALMYIPVSPHETGKKPNTTGEVHIWIKECLQLPMLRENKINSFVKCTILPDTSRKSRQKTRTIDKTQSPFFNHTMVYDGFKEADLREACVELTAWDHNKLSNHFIGGLRLGFGTGKSYGTAVDWMDSSLEEATMWEKMIASPSTWIEGLLPLRMFKMAKLSKYT
ncbi:uncharacterized protein [Engystomops pustulosus]|uniref:uncharacterized protein isoform X8 n=1 Tax=Engystomops pustulosus TaxID=76066 RepID=UPI003AFA10FC